MRSRTLFLLIGALGILLIAFLSYAWWYRETLLLDAAVSQKTETILQKSVREVRVARAQAALDEIDMFTERLAGRYVSNETIVVFLDSLEALGRSLGGATTVSSVSVREATEFDPSFFAIDLEIIGSFNTVMRTIGSVENLSHWSRVEKGMVELIPAIDGKSSAWRGVVTVLVAKQ